MRAIKEYITVIALIAAAFAVPAWAEPSVTIAIRPKTILVDVEKGTLTLVSHQAQPKLKALPEVGGIKWLFNGRGDKRYSFSMNAAGRLSTYTTTYFFVATHEGTIEIPALDVLVSGQKVSVPGAKLVAMKNKVTSGGKLVLIDELVFLRLEYNGNEAPPKTIFTGQLVDVTAKLYIAAGTAGINLDTSRFHHQNVFFPVLKIEGVVFRNYLSRENRYNSRFSYPAPKTYTVIGGRRFTVYSYPFTINKIMAGTFSGTVTHAVPLLRSKMPDLFDRHTKSRFVHRVSAEIPTIDVRAVPPPPKDGTMFLGLVGQWHLELEPDKTEIRQDEDDLGLVLKVTGRGNIESLQADKLNLPGFKGYEPTVKKRPGFRGSEGTVEWTVIPRSADSTLAEISFSTFDPVKDSYRVYSFTPQVTILPGEIVDSGQGPAFADYTPGSPQGRDLHPSDDILYIKTRPGKAVVLPLWRQTATAAAVLTVVGPVACVLLLLFGARRERMADDDVLRRKHQARSRRGAIQRKIRDGNPETLAEIVRDDLVPYLIDVKELPPGAGLDELAHALEDDELNDILRRAEQQRFMPGARAGIEPRLLLEKLRRIGLMTVVFGFFAFTAFAAAAIPAGDRFDEATAAYEQDDLAAAEAIYVEALEKNPGSSSALYNLGNCAYRRGQFGKAIAFFERARRLAPRDPDILANLNFVRSELNMTPVNAIDDPISLLASLRDHLRPDEWLVVAATGWCLTLIMVGFWRRRRFLKYRWTVLIPATLCILACAALFMQKRNTYRSNQGVVIAADIPVFAVPQPKQTNPKMHLRQGDYVSIEEERGAWIRVRIDQAEGWLESKAVGRIWGER